MSRAPSNRHAQRIAVVGSGVAGSTAARTLRREGFRVSVFDKGRGPGGRTCRRRVSDFEFDHGAPYFTVRDPSFARLVDECRELGVVDEWRHRRVRISGDGISPAGEEAIYVGVPGMSALVRCLLEGLAPRYESRIEQFAWISRRWRVVNAEGERVGDFDGVVLAIPAPQAAALLEAEANELATRARGVSMRPCWSLMLAFEKPLQVEFDSARVEGGSSIQWVGRNNSKPARPSGEAWVIHGSHDWSEARLEIERDDAAVQLLEASRELLAPGWTSPIFSAAHRWRYARVDEPVGESCLVDSERKLAVAGDWMLGPRVEAAFQSGLAAAERLIECWK